MKKHKGYGTDFVTNNADLEVEPGAAGVTIPVSLIKLHQL